MKKREVKIPPQGKVRLNEALQRLVSLYESRGSTGDAERAASYRKLLDQRKPRGNNHPTRQQVERFSGRCPSRAPHRRFSIRP